MIKVLGVKLTKELLFLPIAVTIFAVLRLPSVIEPYWYGDEGIYEVLGMAIARGRILYEGIWDNKPPLLYLLYAIFDGQQFYLRVLSLIFGALSVVAFFFLAKKLFKKDLSTYVSTAIFTIIFATPVIEGNIANAENFMLLPIIGAYYLVVVAQDSKKIIYTAVAGFLLSLAALTKIVAIFDLAALALSIFMLRFYGTITLDKKDIKKELKAALLGIEQETVLILSFLLPMILFAIYFLSVGAFPDFWRATFSQNVGYVGYGNHFLFPMGLLFLKVAGLLFFVLIVFRYRHYFGRNGVIILIWLLFSLFNALFSARPYTHYLIVLLPSFALFVGYMMEEKRRIVVALLIFIAAVFLIDRSFNFYTKIPRYYANYINFISGGDLTTYQSFFDRKTPRDYEIAEFIRMKTGDNEEVFLWSDSAQIYALANKLPPGRYAVAYHVTFYPEGIKETKEAIERVRPKYIIQTKDHPAIYEFLDGYELKYTIDDVKIYEREV